MGSSSDDNYVIFRPRECGFRDVFLSLFPSAPARGTHCSSSLRGMVENNWQAKFVMLILKLLHAVSRVLTIIGEFIEVCLNTIHVNGGLLKMIKKMVSGEGVIIPDEGSDDYWSVIGFLDPRTDLLIQSRDQHSSYFANKSPASKLVADVCMLASKLAYENSKVIRKVVREEWKMHIVEVYECINSKLLNLHIPMLQRLIQRAWMVMTEYEPTNPTQVFLFMDRAEDAQAILVTFRGTMPFNAYDWSTDFDFSWYELPGIGRVHVGFLEALSLVDRHDMESFDRMKSNIFETRKNGRKSRSASGLREAANEDNKPRLAYDAACDKVKELLKVHKNAKVYVTGHSLGGALATVFTTMLFFNMEDMVTEKLAALYTFGQPRVGDKEFAATMTNKLNASVNRFFRVVYSNDLVPRVPFDDFLFQFKHIEPCFFYNSIYNETTMNEEPNKNYFSPLYYLSVYTVAAWELVQSFLLPYKFGDNYRESATSTVFRIVGLIFPGIAAHSPVNYVNSVRLGPDTLSAELLTAQVAG